MRVVTFNIRCDYDQDGENSFRFRKALILEKIKKESPDVICFQEVLPHVAQWLKSNLQEYYIVGCGRSQELMDEQTSIAYKKECFNLIQMEVFWLSDTPQVAGSRYEDQSECPRICTEVLLWNLEDKKKYLICNTHLDHIGEGARILGLRQILKRSRAHADVPVIITGDFNAFPGDDTMKVWNEYPEYRDLTAGLGGTFHDFGKLGEPEKIDYLFAQNSIHCREAVRWEDCVNGVYLSDHYPVSVEIYTK